METGTQLIWLGATAIGLLAGVIMLRPCLHQHPSLQPPVPGGGPSRDHARWYCERCGRSWPAVFAPPHAKPRVCFTGYDHAKAVQAAARVAALELGQRRLAVERAGLPGVATPGGRTARS